MPYLETAQSWLTQSTLLLQARPSTTRITTKYTIKPPPDTSVPIQPRKPKSKSTSKAVPSDPSNPSTTESTASSQPTQTTPPEPIRATLTLKTYDPVSGTTLKYSTTKAAEVSRLIQILGRLARPMSGLPEVKEDIAMIDAAAVGGEGSGVATPVLESAKQVQQGGAAGGGGSKKKGKKGKK